MVVLAARPAMGKSAFVTNLAENVALQNKGAVALFSLEMPERRLLQRAIASQAAIKGDDVTRAASATRWGDVLETADKLAQAPSTSTTPPTSGSWRSAQAGGCVAPAACRS